MDATRADQWADAREGMIADITCRGLHDVHVLGAMRRVPRHLFVPPGATASEAYGDHPLAIGHGQTISQPYIVAYMALLLEIHPGMKVLDVGTGSGYQAAILAELGAQVYSIERIPELAARARQTLSACGYGGIQVRLGDGFAGWPDIAPFERILTACAPLCIPPVLIDELADDGRMVLPVGGGAQRLVLVRRCGGTIDQRDDLWVRFVPMLCG